MAFTWSSVVKGKKMTPKEEEEQKQTNAMIDVEHKPFHFLDVPLTVNERALKFIERVLLKNREWPTTCLTVGALRDAFYAVYVPYIFTQYANCIDTFLQWEREHLLDLADTPDSKDRYDHLQAWVHFLQKKFDEPWRNPLWIFAKNVTFNSCLWALNVKSETFAQYGSGPQYATNNTLTFGFIEILGPPFNPSSPIKWLITDFLAYHNGAGVPHKAKAATQIKTATNKYS